MANSDTERKARIHGFFVQPSLGYGAANEVKFSSQDEYDRWVQSMADVGAEMLFYQWVLHFEADLPYWFAADPPDGYGGNPASDFAFYNPNLDPDPLNDIAARGWVTPTSWTGSPKTGGKEPVAYLLDAAQKARIKVWLGLYLNEGSGDFSRYNWWDAIIDGTLTQADKDAIKHNVDRSVAVVKDFADQFGTHPALGGIYYSVEITNQQAFIKNHAYLAEEIINPVAKAVHAELPGKELAISPFFNTHFDTDPAFGSPEEFGEMWEYVLKNSELDILILQDGVGVEPHTLRQEVDNNGQIQTIDKISGYFDAVKKAADAAGKPLWGNAELFQNINSPNRSCTEEKPCIPSNIDKISLQLKTEAQYVEKFVCFDFHYMEPNDIYTFNPVLYGDTDGDGKIDPSKDIKMRQTLYDSYMEYWKKWQTNHSVN